MSSGEDNGDLVPDVSSDDNENVGSGTEFVTADRNIVPDVSSDDNESGNEAVNVTSQDLFGDADDISSSDSDASFGAEESAAAASLLASTSQQQQRQGRATMDDDDDGGGHGFDIGGGGLAGFPGFPDDDDDEDGGQDVEPVTNVIEADMPIFPSMMGEQSFFVKMPNFLSVEPRAFDAEYYDEEVDEDELQDEEGRSRLKLKIENTIRWRYAKDAAGDVENEEGRERESNARIVRWSDGSASLLLGSEVFDIHQTALGSGDFSHLFVQQGTGLQGQAVFRSKLTFRPHSTDSHTHRKITMSIADRLGKTQKIRVLPVVGKDPDAHRTQMMKKEEERLRSAVRLENQQRRSRERNYSRGRPTVSFLEGMGDDDDDDDDETSISAIKRSVSGGRRTAKKPSSRPQAKKKKKPSAKKRSGGGSSDEDDEEDEGDDDGDGYDDGDGFIDDGDDGSDDEEEEVEEEEGVEAEEEEARSTSEEDVPVVEKPKKRKATEKDSPSAAQKKKKKVRSKNVISSSDDDSS